MIKITLPTSKVLTDPEVILMRDSLLYGDGVTPDRELSGNGTTVFFLSQITQGYLPFILSKGGTVEGYDFYMEINKSLLDVDISEMFPEPWADEEAGNTKTLRAYLPTSGVQIKDDKALVILLRANIGRSTTAHEDVTSFKLLEAFIANYNPNCDKIYTSKESIAAKLEEYRPAI